MKDYSDLPESMKTTELAPEFDELLSGWVDGAVTSEQMLEALRELANRQWHAYELASPETRQKVQEWFIENWNDESLDFVQAATWVAGMMGLQVLIDRLQQCLETNLAAPIRKEIEDYMTETKGDVRDPYSSLRNLQKKE